MPSLIPLSKQDVDEVLRLANDKIVAVAHVRRVTGAGLADAAFTVETLLREAGRVQAPAVKELGGEVLAIGPYHRDLDPSIDCVELASTEIREGTLIVETLVFIENDSQALHELAAGFHTSPWDFNTHALDPWRADLQALQAFDEKFDDDGLVDKLVALRVAGFTFHFRLYPPDES